MAGSIQRAVKLDERRGFENVGSSPVVQSDKQQKLEGGANANSQRKSQLQQEALQRLQRRRVTEGRGGGFNDRQDASDKKEWDSDDEEFDDFGRRKKRKVGTAAVRKKKEVEPDRSQHPGDSPSSSSAHRSSPPDPVNGQRVEGVVRWYESQKAFGFVRTPGIDKDIYFKDQDRSLAPVEGMRVTFILKITPDGKPQARNMMRGTLAAAAHSQGPTAAAKSSADPQMGGIGSCPPSSSEAMLYQAQMMMHMQMMASQGTSDAPAPAGNDAELNGYVEHY